MQHRSCVLVRVSLTVCPGRPVWRLPSQEPPLWRRVWLFFLAAHHGSHPGGGGGGGGRGAENGPERPPRLASLFPTTPSTLPQRCWTPSTMASCQPSPRSMTEGTCAQSAAVLVLVARARPPLDPCISAGKSVTECRGHTHWVTCCVHDGAYLWTGSADMTVRVWE